MGTYVPNIEMHIFLVADGSLSSIVPAAFMNQESQATSISAPSKTLIDHVLRMYSVQVPTQVPGYRRLGTTLAKRPPQPCHRTPEQGETE